MCGISGIIDKRNRPVPEAEIRGMCDVIHHRGPDSRGYYHGNNFSLGHRRLAIIDLSPDGHQPMDYHGRYVIVYNGEIYNYIEIKKELSDAGYTFRTHSDTEVILASYDMWGYDCVNKFNGMWSFAIYDKVKNVIFCSRDRFGIKPFYFYNTADRFYFSSEIKQLLEFLPKRSLNASQLMDYLVIGFEEHNNDTFFRGIHKLEQSHNLIYDLKTHEHKIVRYYELKPDSGIKALTDDESIDLYRDKFFDSVMLRLRSDVKVGTCLSGGLDSSSVAAYASLLYAANSGNRFSAITAKSIESKNDESSFAAAVAEKSNLDWHITEPSSKNFFESLHKVIALQEEPFGTPSIFMQYFVFQKAKEQGCIVMLDGQGGDETLLGYERYYPAFLLSLPVAERISNFFLSSRNSKLSQADLLKYYFYFTSYNLRLRRILNRAGFIRPQYFDLLSTDVLRESSDNFTDVTAMQIHELTKLQLPHLLKYEDRNSMAHSIESRLPFLDYRLVEAAISLKSSIKIRDGWTKYVLRKSTEDILPPEISWRKNKFGFEAPAAKWLSSIDGKIMESIRQSSILRRITVGNSLEKKYYSFDPVTKWKLFNIAEWERIYNVEID